MGLGAAGLAEQGVEEGAERGRVVTWSGEDGGRDAQRFELGSVRSGAFVRGAGGGEQDVVQGAAERASEAERGRDVVKHAQRVGCDEEPEGGVECASEVEVREIWSEGAEQAVGGLDQRSLGNAVANGLM